LHCTMNGLSLLVALCLALPAARVAAESERVVVVDPLASIRTEADVKPIGETLRLVGPRNGFCSAQVVAFRSVTAARPVLRGPGGEIPADCVRITYAVMESPYKPPEVSNAPWLPEQWRFEPRYDVLHAAPPAEAEILPVWLTVRVPAGQVPGEYGGTMKVGGTDVPVRLTVCDWVCPDPADWVTYMGLVHSPETMARHYGVEPWSDEHWALVEKELRFAAALGDRMISLPVYHRTDLCEYPWIRFRVQGDGYEPDFSIVERYLGLFKRIVGKPKTIVVMAWSGGKCAPDIYGSNKGRPKSQAPIVVVDGAGALTPVQVPVCGLPGSEKVFAPLMDGVRERVLALGWPEETVLIGWATDRRPSRAQVDFFKRIAPWARWAIFTHGRGDSGSDWQTGAAQKAEGVRIVEGMEIGHYVHPEAPRVYPVPMGECDEPHTDGIAGGWDLPYPEYLNFRVYMYHTASLAQYRSFPGGSMVRGSTVYKGHERASGAGMSNIPLDFWEDESGRSMLGTYGRDWAGGFHRHNSFWLIAPGPDGPVSTERFEMLREGMQETEARVAIEKALAAGALPADLADRCRAHLLERMKVQWKDGQFARSNSQWQKGGWHDYGIAENWQDSTARLFDLAGQVGH